MNINEELRELATMGGLAYTPSAESIAALVGKTKRARVARQSVTTAATTFGVAALGLAAAQVYSATKDDPAFQDRNIIYKENLTPIEQYRAKFGKENPTRNNASVIDLNSIIDSLKKTNSKPTAPNNATPAGPSTPTAPVNANPKPTAPEPTKPPKGDSTCDPNQTREAGEYYDCSSKQWLVRDGYFRFGNQHVYTMIKWTDAATGAQAWGNWSGTGVDWEKKAIHMGESNDKLFQYEDDFYIYMGDNATFSGTTCDGKVKTKWNATMKASCMPESVAQAKGLTYKKHSDIVWILQDTYKKWCDCTGQFEDPNNPPAGLQWNPGGWWESVPDPAPTTAAPTT